MRSSGACRRALALAAAVILLAPSAASAGALLIRARRVYPVSSAPIDGGKVVVRDGRIAEVGVEVSVGPGDSGVRVIDVRGSLIPGLIDCGSTIGIGGRVAEEFREMTPEIRALDGVDLDSPELDRALEEGITAAGVSAGARNVIGGLGAVIRTGPRGQSRRDALLRGDAFLDVSLDEEAAAGNMNLRLARPATYAFRLPNTRMGTVFLVRRALFEVAERLETSSVPGLLGAEGRALLRGALRG